MITYLRARVHDAARDLGTSEEGATATEYVFLIVFIAIAAAIGMVVLGQGLLDIFDSTGTEVGSAGPGSLPAAPSGASGGGGGS